MNSSSDEEEMLALFTLMRKGRKRKWIHEINMKREQLGEYHRLCRELECFEDIFFVYFRMSRECFESYFPPFFRLLHNVFVVWMSRIVQKLVFSHFFYNHFCLHVATRTQNAAGNRLETQTETSPLRPPPARCGRTEHVWWG